jgi:cold shock CspA family protein
MNVSKEIETIEEIKTGTIKSILKNGYGFITDDDDEGNDVFFHVTGCVEPKFNDLREGMKVNYLLSTRNDKPIAIGIVGI